MSFALALWLLSSWPLSLSAFEWWPLVWWPLSSFASTWSASELLPLALSWPSVWSFGSLALRSWQSGAAEKYLNTILKDIEILTNENIWYPQSCRLYHELLFKYFFSLRKE